MKNKVAEDLKPEADRIKFTACAHCPHPDETPVSYEPGPGGLLYALGELARLHLPDLSGMFAETTGGRALSFLKKDSLEQTIQQVSQEVHRQYILTFTPRTEDAGAFHSIRVIVRNTPGLRVTARSGYWAVQ